MNTNPNTGDIIMVATATAKTPRVTKAAAAKAEAAEAAAPAQETDAQKRNRLRNEAERHILNLHKDEFDDYAEDLFAKNGLTFNRRLSEAQKAEKKINDLIAAHPELEGMLRAKFEPTDADAPAETAPPVGPTVHSTGQWDGPEDNAGEPQVDYSADEANYEDPFRQQG
jgi:replicative superfamily II helicase